MSEKPTFSDLKDLLARCEKIYEPLWEKFEEDEKYYELDFRGELAIPDEFQSEGMVLPTARDFVDTFVDYIDIGNARVYVPKKGSEKKDLDAAEIMEQIYLGMLYVTNVEADISPWRVGAKHYAAHGLSVFKTVWDKNRAKQGLLPVVIQAVNPRCVIPDPSYVGRRFVFERHKKLVMDVQKLWPNWKNTKGRGQKDEVDYVSYWDDQYRCDWIDEETILKGDVVKHKYGFIPYVFIDSGLGNLSYEAKPEQRYVGILRYIKDLLISESRNYSIDDIILSKAAWPWFTAEGDNAPQLTSLDQKYGQVTTLPQGVTLIERKPAVAPEELRTHLDRTSYYLSAHAAPNVLRGLPEPNVRSGAHERYRVGQAAARYRYSEEAFKHGAAKILMNCAKIIKHVVPNDIWLWAKTPKGEIDLEVKKDMMKEPFNCAVEFAPISPEDEYRRHDNLRLMVRSGIIDQDFARRQMPEVDPVAMKRRERKAELRQSPAYSQKLNQMIDQKLSEKLPAPQPMPAPQQPPRQQAMPQMPQMPQGGQDIRRMVPPMRNVAPMGSGQEMANKIKAAQSPVPEFPGQGEGGGGNR